MLNKKPYFTVIIPHRNTESTEAIVKQLKKEKKIPLEIYTISGNQPSYQRNQGIKKAKGEVIYFLDNDALPDLKNLAIIKKIFKENKNIAAAGGPSLTPDTDTIKQRVFGSVLGSFWGSFFMRARYCKLGKPRFTSDRELILCNLAIKKKILDKVGVFNQKLYPNEENELMDRILQNGFSLYYHPEISVERSQRQGFKDYIRQMMTYGRGRAEQLKASFVVSNLPIFAFLFFPVYMILSVVLSFFKPVFMLAILPYITLMIVSSVFISIKLKKLVSFLYSLLSFFICHFFYGIGLWRGLLTKMRSKKIIPKAIIKKRR